MPTYSTRSLNKLIFKLTMMFSLNVYQGTTNVSKTFTQTTTTLVRECEIK